MIRLNGVDVVENDWKLDLFCRLHWPTETAVLQNDQEINFDMFRFQIRSLFALQLWQAQLPSLECFCSLEKFARINSGGKYETGDDKEWQPLCINFFSYQCTFVLFRQAGLSFKAFCPVLLS